MKLKEFLEKKKISYREMARFCDLCYATIFKISRGTIPTHKTADTIVKNTKGEVGYADLGYSCVDGKWVRHYDEVPD